MTNHVHKITLYEQTNEGIQYIPNSTILATHNSYSLKAGIKVYSSNMEIVVTCLRLSVTMAWPSYTLSVITINSFSITQYVYCNTTKVPYLRFTFLHVLYFSWIFLRHFPILKFFLIKDLGGWMVKVDDF